MSFRVAFLELQIVFYENFKILFYELPVHFYKLKVRDDKFTGWKFSCKVAFYKLNIYDGDLTNYHHMVESINLCKLREKAILIKCILAFDKLNTH